MFSPATTLVNYQTLFSVSSVISVVKWSFLGGLSPSVVKWLERDIEFVWQHDIRWWQLTHFAHLCERRTATQQFMQSLE